MVQNHCRQSLVWIGCAMFFGLAFSVLLTGLSASAQTGSDDDAPAVVAPPDSDWDETLPCEKADAVRAQEPDRTARNPYLLPSLCQLTTKELSEAEAKRRLRSKPFKVSVVGDVVTVLARSDTPLTLCCSIQGDLKQIGTTSFWAGRYRLRNIERANLLLFAFDPSAQNGETDPVTFRGKTARKVPRVAKIDRHTSALSQHTVLNPQSGQKRSVWVYTPPHLSSGERYPVIYLTDHTSKLFAPFVDRAVRHGEIPPVFLVSSNSDAFRWEEYIPNRSDRYAEHFQFFTKALPEWAEANLPVSSTPEDRLVAGYSNGADFAIAAGSASEKMFAAVIAMSPGFAPKSPAPCADGDDRHFYLSGGYYEIGFLRSAAASSSTLEAAGCSTRLTAYHAGHDTDQWAMAFMDALKDHFAKPDD